MTASIDIWHYFQDSPQTKQLFAAWTAEFNAKYPNVKVNFVYVPYDQMNNKLLLSGQQGSGPDGALYDPSNAAALMSAKAIVDMAPYVNNWSDLSQIAKSAVWKSGDQVLSIQGYVNLLGFYYNKDVLTKAGVKPATTVAELQAQLPKLKAVGVNALDIPGKPTADGEFGAFPWFLGEGVNYTNLSSPVTTTVLARTAQWVKDGYVPKDAAVWGPTEAFADWIKGNAAYCQCGNWELGTAKTDAKFAYGVVAQPAGAAGSHVVGGGEGASIGSAAKNPALVAEFFKLTVLSKAGQLAFLTINGGLPTRLDAGKDPSVTSNALLAPFAGEVANTGSRPSSPKISRAMIAMGTAWSAALSGQQSPSGAAQTLASSVAQIMN
ncbi:MAG: sugar ABC transporter substrate-binding protein [Nakamurella sp.]